MTVLLHWLQCNPDAASMLFFVLAVSIAKLPDPRKYADRKWGWAYDIFFQVASRVSFTAWNRFCGPMKMPGIQVPPLEEHPVDS